MAPIHAQAGNDSGHASASSGQVVRADVTWRGQKQTIEGMLAATFMIVNGQVMAKLLNVHPSLEGNDDADIWAPAQSLGSAREGGTNSVVLRSDIREIPAGQAREYALRTLSLTLSQFVEAYGVHIALSPSVADMHDLSLTMDVPGSDGTDYLWKFQLATRQCRTHPTVWNLPPAPVAEASLHERDRPNAAHYTGQLPLWLTTRRFWSVFRWHAGGLQHIVQFSLPNKLQRALIRRFRLQSI